MNLTTIVLALPAALEAQPNCIINGRYAFTDGKITLHLPNDEGAVNILKNYYSCTVVSETALKTDGKSDDADNSLSVNVTNADAARIAQIDKAKAEAEAKAKAEADAKAKAEADAKAKAEAEAKAKAEADAKAKAN